MNLDAHVLNNSGEIKMGAAGNWKLTDTIIVNQSGDGDYTTIAAALAAASSGDLVLVDRGTYTESDLTVPDNVSLAGIAFGAVTLNPTTGTDVMSLEGDNNIINLSITTAAAVLVVFQINGGGFRFIDCSVGYNGFSSSDSYVFKNDVNTAGSNYIQHCIVETTQSSSGNTYFYDGTAGGTVYISGGTYNGSSIKCIGFRASATHTINLDEQPRIFALGGSMVGTGTHYGAYFEGTEMVFTGTDLVGRDSEYPNIGTTTTAKKFGDIHLASGKDIYPDEATVGLQYRVEQMFGDNVPADPYHFTQRLFTLNNFTGHVAGFEDAQSSPYSFGGSPGGWAVGVPANTFARSDTWRHFLTLQNAAGTGVGLRWLDATGKNNIAIIGAAASLWTSSDYNLCEIRMFDTTTPGGGSNYWAMRINWMGATYPGYPLRYGLWYGTGITYAWNNGTLVSFQAPMLGDGTVIRLKGIVTSGPSFFLTPSAAEGTDGVGISHTQAGWPTVIKYAIVRLDINYTMFHVDEMRLY